TVLSQVVADVFGLSMTDVRVTTDLDTPRMHGPSNPEIIRAASLQQWRERRIWPRAGFATSFPGSPPHGSMCGPKTLYLPAARSLPRPTRMRRFFFPALRR